MVLLGRSSNTPKHPQTSLFDIRLNSSDYDVLVIKGSPNEASSVLLSGTIVLSVLEPISIKKLNLKLYGTLRLKWTNQYETSKGTILKKPYRYEKRVFEYIWDDIDVSHHINTCANNSGTTSPLRSRNSSANSSSTSLKNLGTQMRSKSSSNLTTFGSSASLASMSNNGSNTTTTLPEGNYEFPFSTILQGSTLESVEGLPGASLVYKLQANIERGRFSQDLSVKKHLRIVRTLTPDSLELSETMAVDNTWPKKVEYTISIPARAVAIGSATPIHVTLVPLAKGLKLGKVKVALQEYYSCAGSFGPPHSGERIITDFTVPSADQDVNEDRWEINTVMSIPPSLSKCTQDVDILTNIKVRHKLKFVIGLINPDGHVSELRASLPMVLFVSPFVALAVKNFDRKDSVVDSAFNDIPSDDDSVIDEDDVIFSPDPETLSSSLPAGGAGGVGVSDIDREAPPNYGNHIYDRLWSEVSVENTPDASRITTPNPGTPIFSNPGENLNDRNLGRFTENLRRLHLQQHLQETPSLDSIATAPININRNNGNNNHEEEDEDDDEEGGLTFQARIPRRVHTSETPINEVDSSSQMDYFSMSRGTTDHSSINGFNGTLQSPGISSPPINHISRSNSFSNLDSSSSPPNLTKKDWDASQMSQVPSYQTAMKSSTNLLSLSPSYQGNGLGQDVDDFLIRPKSIHLKSSSLSNSRAQSTQFLSSLRNSSSSNLSTLHHPHMNESNHSHSFIKSPTLSRSNSKSVLSSSFKSSMTPLEQTSSSHSHHGSTANLHHNGNGGSSTSMPSLGSKSTSFVNIVGGFIHRKERK